MPDRCLDGISPEDVGTASPSLAAGKSNSLILPACLPGEGLRQALAKAAAFTTVGPGGRPFDERDARSVSALVAGDWGGRGRVRRNEMRPGESNAHESLFEEIVIFGTFIAEKAVEYKLARLV